MAFEYMTTRGHAYSFSGWNPGERPSECFDRQDWLNCLHGCMLCAQFESNARVSLEDDGVLHELLHLAMRMDISTHNSLLHLRHEIVDLEAEMEEFAQRRPAMAEGSRPPSGVELIEAERKRQIDIEGWTPEHDDKHTRGEMSWAARAYVSVAANQAYLPSDDVLLERGWIELPYGSWPWSEKWWKPSRNLVRNLVKAGALIAAEIDRLQRAAPSRGTDGRPLDAQDASAAFPWKQGFWFCADAAFVICGLCGAWVDGREQSTHEEFHRRLGSDARACVETVSIR